MTPPRATYRLQLCPDFDFDGVAGVADYLAELGVTHAYLSPCLEAAPGSTHGYDVISHRRIREALGGVAGHRRMTAALGARGLGVLLDIVPNHMAIGTAANEWWWDVLEHGPSSRFARHFDVDWPGGDDDRILLPILGERYADALASGALRIDRVEGRWVVRYHDHVLPASPASAADLDAETAAAISADPARLDAFLERQAWRLGFWRYALGELPYRRFFDVATLAGLRIEDPQVFDDVHGLVLGWLRDRTIDGIRIDHVDGLRDPTGYLERLRRRAPEAWIVVEKILAPDERLPPGWPIDGTTGYELIRVMDGAFVDPEARPAFEALWRAWGGEDEPWPAQARRARLDAVHRLLASERDRLVALAARMIAGERELRDVTGRELGDAITELLATLPVYRLYARPGAPASAEDVARLDGAIAAASAQRPDVDRRVWAALRGALLLERPGADATELALRFQQTSGAVMAKGIEDTLFYRNAMFAALCEVGGAPERFGVELDELHETLAATPPRSLVASATHDTKRGEDVRARLAVLSEIPDAWGAAVGRWSERARPYRTGELPDKPTEYLMWQTVVGAWPIEPPRLRAYLEKATREAKVHTSWLSPDAGYEEAVARFADGVLGDADLRADLDGFARSLATPTWRNILARTAIKLTTRGVPDLYQGTELLDLSLVDPDNRRPVDYAIRRAMLARARDLTPEQAMAAADEGMPKLWLTHRLLALRARQPDWFAGEQGRLEVTGPHAARVIAFARGADRSVITIAPRLSAHVASWEGTAVQLDPGAWIDALTAEIVDVGAGGLPVERAWARFPVAVLWRPG